MSGCITRLKNVSVFNKVINVKATYNVLVCALLFATGFVSAANAEHVITEIERLKRDSLGVLHQSYAFGFPNDETPISVYGTELFGKEWDCDRNMWRYRWRFDWYQSKRGEPFGDEGWDEWPYVVLQVDLSITTSGIVPGSGNAFAFGGWNVQEHDTGDFEEIGKTVCSAVISLFPPWYSLTFGTGLALAQALRDSPQDPQYEWMGLQIKEASGFYQYDCYIYPETDWEIKFKLDFWGSSIDRGYQDYWMRWTWHGSSLPPPEPNLSCSGSLSWTEVEPGDIVTGSFNIENVGDPSSQLDWKVDSWPNWGDWTFNSASGNDLTPEYGQVTVDVSVEAPDVDTTTFTGEVKIVNEEDSGDYCTIAVSLTTPRPRPCFLAGTQIAMPDGSYKNIENIKVGDLVKCYDFKKARVSYARVTKVYRHNEKEMTDYYIVIDKFLRVTPNHPLYINGKWTEAGKAKPGDRLLSVHGSIIIIKSVEKVFERVPTYNIEVAGYQNFFASEVLAAQKFALSEEILSDPGFMRDKPIGLGDDRVPESFALSQNYPNPFNPETTIKFDLSEPCPVSLRIYNVRGQLVRELIDGYREHGSHEVFWDGRNSQGHLVPSGIYFCRMRSGDFAATMKMALIK